MFKYANEMHRLGLEILERQMSRVRGRHEEDGRRKVVKGFEMARNWNRREFQNALARVKWSFATRLRERTGTKVSKAYLVGLV
jgi:hypothetical protein